jgi:hypothetical protein
MRLPVEGFFKLDFKGLDDAATPLAIKSSPSASDPSASSGMECGRSVPAFWLGTRGNGSLTPDLGLEESLGNIGSLALPSAIRDNRGDGSTE